ncbi:MAG: hypothetical protein J4F46_08470, partial [Dehalococcoidia bacterium]|nr:hypothetical protein [Dehalococcoidia bacterium]
MPIRRLKDKRQKGRLPFLRCPLAQFVRVADFGLQLEVGATGVPFQTPIVPVSGMGYDATSLLMLGLIERIADDMTWQRSGVLAIFDKHFAVD